MACLRWLGFFSFVAALAVLSGCGDTETSGDKKASEPQATTTSAAKPLAAGRRGSVVVFSPHGQEMLDEYAAAFHRAYPGIEVTGRFVPTGQILSQLRIDRSSPRIDVWWGGTSAFFSQAAKEALLQPYRPSWAVALPEGFHDPNDLWYGQFLTVPAIMFNKNIQTREQIPSTWEALLEPQWRDRIVIREPLDSGTMKTILTGLIWRLGGPNHDPQPGYEFLKRLDGQTHAYLPNPQALYDRVAKSAEGYISLWNLTDIIFQAKANGYPFDYRVPEGPFPFAVDPIAIVAGAPHPGEARLFYEFATSKENCLKMARDHFRILARNDIAPNELPEWMNGLRLEPMPVKTEDFDRLQTEWMDHWRQAIRDSNK